MLSGSKSISDLAEMYSLRTMTPNWKRTMQKSLDSVKKRKENKGYSVDERFDAIDLYTWMIGNIVAKLPGERKDTWDVVDTIWKELDAIDLTSDSWRVDLRIWNRRARSLLKDLALELTS